MIEVFLGGTCNNSDWRDVLTPMLECIAFNPVVDDWTEEAQQIEIQKRETCDLVLYVITPRMKGVYSIAEAVYDACNRPEKTVFTYLDFDNSLGENIEFDPHQLKSIEQTRKLIESCGAKTFDNLLETANYINDFNKNYYKI